MVIVTVNSPDTESCSKKLRDLIKDRKNIAVFSLQRGVRNSATVKDEYVFPLHCLYLFCLTLCNVVCSRRIGSTAAIAIVEGVVGFGVVLDSKNSAYTATTRHPSLMFERLSREAVRVADGPMNLLETMELDFHFRKVLTRKCID